MKNCISFLISLFYAVLIYGQVPEKMSYQAIIRNETDNLVNNQSIGMQISILHGSPDGTAVYIETQTPTTNVNGLVSIEIGSGTVVSGNFSTIDWGNERYFIKTETDPTGGTSYSITGTTQLLSVPYALYAKSAETISGGITESQITDLGNYLTTEVDSSVSNELQALSISNDTIYLSNGGFVKLPAPIETDPVFETSIAGSITGTDTANWNNKLESYIETQNLYAVLTLGNSAGNKNITNLADPVNNKDATTKAYVDKLETRIEAMENLLIESGLYTLTDVEGNVYDIVIIGTQVWMAENLKTTHYNDGTPIPLVTEDTAWAKTRTPAYCWVNNDSAAYAQTYGALYNWYTVKTGNLCPTGWHVPSYTDWTILANFLGGESVAGGKLKEADTINWASPNVSATNETDFTALPGGFRFTSGDFYYFGKFGYWWATKEAATYSAYCRKIYHNYSNLYDNFSIKWEGLSVRCLKD